jgi:tRNA nucleotidyltransferase (CCA-adding enzyme)
MKNKDQILLESLYERILKENDNDFSDKWNTALNNSEELRNAVDLMKNIKSIFPSGEIYIVGGVPRDLLMGNEVDDVDLSTNIPFEKLQDKFEIRNISKNDSQPVYDIKWNDYHYDLAKFRTDSGDIGRQNNISTETDSFVNDTERRDLTINSFGIDEKGNIIDHQNGLEDLKNKIVRAVGDPKKRFMEDATRILRVFRFAAKMGFDLDEQTRNAAVELKDILSNPELISSESIAKEFYKSAKSGKTLMQFLKMLQDNKILHDILPEFTSMEGYMHNPKHHPEGESKVLGHIYECLSVSPFKDPVINLAILFHDFGKSTTRGEKEGQSTYYGHEEAGVPIVENIFRRLKFNELSAEDKKNILQAVAKHMLVHNLDNLNIKTLSKLILDPSWNIVKSVAYCDEASRGIGLFNKKEFDEKIKRAEEKVSNLGGDSEDLRKKIKQYIDGGKLMRWYPELYQKPKFGIILKKAQDHVLELLNSNEEPNDDGIKKYIDSVYNESTFTFKEYFLKEQEESFTFPLTVYNLNILKQ